MFPRVLWHNWWNCTLGRRGKRPKLVLEPVVPQLCFVVGTPYWFRLSRPPQSILLCAEKIVNNQGEKHKFFLHQLVYTVPHTDGELCIRAGWEEEECICFSRQFIGDRWSALLWDTHWSPQQQLAEDVEGNWQDQLVWKYQMCSLKGYGHNESAWPQNAFWFIHDTAEMHIWVATQSLLGSKQCYVYCLHCVRDRVEDSDVSL